MVIGTGYATAKGEMVRSILYPKPTSFDFMKKLYFFIYNLLVFFLAASIFTACFQAIVQDVRRILLLVLLFCPPFPCFLAALPLYPNSYSTFNSGGGCMVKFGPFQALSPQPSALLPCF